MREEKIGQWGNTFVLRRVLEPGEATAWHVDPFQRVTVVLRGNALAIEFRDGGERLAVEVAPGLTDCDEPTARIHRAVNVGREPYEEVLVFLLDRPDAEPQPSFA